MSGRGKMTGSPFHIETAAYKYAIEHENSGYNIPSKPPAPVRCSFWVKTTNACSLWNSGHIYCRSHKCDYYNHSSKKTKKCSSCGYFYKECKHPRKSSSSEQTAYCCYYLSRSSNEYRYLISKRNIIRSEYKKQKDALISRKRYVYQAEKEMSTYTEDSANFKYLKEKIPQKKENILKLEHQLKDIELQLKAVCDEIKKKFPHKPNIKNKNKKPKSKQ